MISKQQQNMAVLDEEPSFSETKSIKMEDIPKNLSLDKKFKCDIEQHLHPPNQSVTTTSNHDMDTDHEMPSEDNANANNESETSENMKNLKSNQSETRIQLSFSVDRLLSSNTASIGSAKSSTPPTTISDRKCCDEASAGGYSCCTLPNCVGSTASPYQTAGTTTAAAAAFHHQQSAEESLALHQHMSQGSFFMDLKSIVRPTPMRAMGNNSETGPQHFAAITPATLIRFHQHMQQKHFNQIANLAPAHQTFALSPLLNGLCGLKPHQNHQVTGVAGHLTMAAHHQYSMPTPNRFAASMTVKNHPFNTFDIPVMRSNLAQHQQHQHSATLPGAAHNNEFARQSPKQTSASSTNLTNVQTSATNRNSSQSAFGGAATSNGKRKRSWSRAVFSNLQRKGLEIQFQQQKYITKPDRRKLAARLNLTDAQVKVWFQNRRMKWRHTRENLKSGHEKPPNSGSANGSSATTANSSSDLQSAPKSQLDCMTYMQDLAGYSTDGSSSSLEMSDNDDEHDDDEIDVVE